MLLGRGIMAITGAEKFIRFNEWDPNVCDEALAKKWNQIFWCHWYSFIVSSASAPMRYR